MEIHGACFGSSLPVMPLTVQSIAQIAAVFKAADYRSFENYLARAREEHISLGHPWTDALKLEGIAAVRS
eukprot:699357-Amphidinium_carterae.1